MSTSVVDLPVAYRDVRAADLRLHLGLPPQDALIVRTFSDGGWAVELRVLGASHQALLRRDGASVCSETVACHLGHDLQGAALPRRHAAATPLVSYRFRSSVERFEPSAFRDRVSALMERLAVDPLAVCGAFPGDTLAVTGARAHFGPGDHASWRTWHAYPQTGEVVATSTRVQRRAPGAGSG